MATVYRAYQPSLDRFVAIKVLPPHPGMDDQFIERFRLEARTIGSLQNPNILPLYDYGVDDDVLYLVMAYVDGGSLADYIDRQLDLHQIERWLRGIASGLDFAHRRGVVHRDIKPANILIDSDNHPLLADFGVVRMLAGGSTLTGTSVVGTPTYMSPEQGQGLDVDGRSDVYSLGVMIYEMLTGSPPYQADTPMQTILKHMTEPLPDILAVNPNLPAALGPIMQKVLAKEPARRYITAVDFAEDFSHAIHNSDDSLSAARSAMPLDRSPMPTLKLPMTAANTENLTQPRPPDSASTISQTIVVRETTNPILLVGVIGIVALVIMVVAVALITQLNAQNPTPQPPVALATTSAEDPSQLATQASFTVIRLDERFKGVLRYNSAERMGDTINLTLLNLRVPAADQKYVAWLTQTDGGEAYKLGNLNVFSTGEANLIYTEPTTQTDTLPFAYNALIVSQEARAADPETPSDTIVYSGWVQLNAASVLLSVLQDDDQGIDGAGLLPSALIEAKFASTHAGLAANATSAIGQRQHAEHTINILLGGNEDLDGNGSGQNPGRGKGVPVFLTAITEQVNSLLRDQTVTPELQLNAENIRICTLNASRWVEEIVAQEKLILVSDSVEAAQPAAERSTELVDYLMNGFDANSNGIVEPFEGECGLNQINDFTTQLANISVFEGVLNADTAD